MKLEQTKRRLLTASAGAVAITALEGIACGNPVAPPMRDPPEYAAPSPPEPAVPPGLEQAPPPPLDAGADAPAVKP